MDKTTTLTEPELNCLKKCREMEAECRSLWIRAMEFSPRLASYCPHWHDFTPPEWSILIAKNSDFINIAPVHLFGFREWYMILSCHPALIDQCPILDKLPEATWNALQKQYPWLQKH